MSEGFDKLKVIGAQKIHEDTHISKGYVQAMLHESFEEMTKIQLFGFVSILEREYGVELDDLKAKISQYFVENSKDKNEEVKVFVSPKRKRNLTPFYISTVVIIFAVVMYLTLNSTSNKNNEVIKVDNSAIENATNNITVVEEVKIVDINESNISVEVVEELVVVEEKMVVKSFKIKPKVRVWLGYIDLETYKKKQTTFKNELDLDPSKDWLLSFGHGHLNIEIDGVENKYTIANNVRFLYKDGQIKKVTLKEFRELNKGSRW